MHMYIHVLYGPFVASSVCVCPLRMECGGKTELRRALAWDGVLVLQRETSFRMN